MHRRRGRPGAVTLLALVRLLETHHGGDEGADLVGLRRQRRLDPRLVVGQRGAVLAEPLGAASDQTEIDRELADQGLAGPGIVGIGRQIGGAKRILRISRSRID